MRKDLYLRDVLADDLPTFFEHQLDLEANYMAAFTAQDPTNQEAFAAHWKKILADATVITKTIIWEGQVVGHVLRYDESGEPNVSFWIGKTCWGKGIATRALPTFLAQVNLARSIYAHVAKDNARSLRVLEKCEFRIVSESEWYANARGEEIEEYILGWMNVFNRLINDRET